MTLQGISESLLVTKRLPGESHVPKEEACSASWEKKRYRRPPELRCWARFLRDVKFCHAKNLVTSTLQGTDTYPTWGKGKSSTQK